ncbi:hypothetical protein Micbo1qcDRAFT_13948 [Microdochium bolleyi]|uniref:Uncharacterized protein n=1 Tax=Microdochium bolleyi TaxID=196109 RepID=A0A136IVM4_9PEZI|nr:hypothetical protein Micbo1qcDRAFT_13948 [Microdochium bolleyi]
MAARHCVGMCEGDKPGTGERVLQALVAVLPATRGLGGARASVQPPPAVHGSRMMGTQAQPIPAVLVASVSHDWSACYGCRETVSTGTLLFRDCGCHSLAGMSPAPEPRQRGRELGSGSTVT